MTTIRLQAMHFKPQLEDYNIFIFVLLSEFMIQLKHWLPRECKSTNIAIYISLLVLIDLSKCLQLGDFNIVMSDNPV